MPEAITKYAVNSSLGTDSFIPLDVLIRNQNVLYASDNLHRMLYSGEYIDGIQAHENAIFSISKFTATNAGTCKIKLFIWVVANRYSSNTYVRIKRNGNIIMSVNTTQTGYRSEYLSFDNISFKNGDKFEIYADYTNETSNGWEIHYKDVGIYGDVTPGIFIIE